MRIEVSTIDDAFLITHDRGYEISLPIVLLTNDKEENIILEDIDLGFAGTKITNVLMMDRQHNILDRVELKKRERTELIVNFKYLDKNLVQIRKNRFKFTLIVKFLSQFKTDVVIDFICSAKVVPTFEENKQLLEKVDLKRKTRFHLFFNLFLSFLILLAFNIWTSQNSDVHGEFINSIGSTLILSGIVLYFGLRFPEIKDIFSSLSSTKDFLNTTEFYLQRDTIQLFNNRFTTIILTALAVLVGYVFLFLLFPVTINIDEGKKISPVLGQDLVTEKKVYFKDTRDLKFVFKRNDREDYNPEKDLEIATLDLDYPWFAIFTTPRISEKPFRLDPISFADCISKNDNEEEFTISDAYQKCKVDEDEDKAINNCFCRILAYLNGTPANALSLDFQNELFKNTRGTFIEQKDLLPIFNELTHLNQNDFGAYLGERSFKNNEYGTELDIKIQNLQEGKMEGRTDIKSKPIVDLINTQYAAMLNQYLETQSPSDPIVERKMNALWTFCSYLAHKQGNNEMDSEHNDKLHLDSLTRKMQSVFLGKMVVAKAHVKFMLLCQQDEIIERDEVDKSILEFVNKNPRNKEDYLQILAESINLTKVKISNYLADELVKELVIQNAVPLDASMRENAILDKLEIFLSYYKILNRRVETRDSERLKKLTNHLYNIIQTSFGQGTDIGILYLQVLGKYRIVLDDNDLKTLDEIVCKRGAGKPAGGTYHYTKLIQTLDPSGTPDSSLIKQAQYWDSNQFKEDCELKRQAARRSTR